MRSQGKNESRFSVEGMGRRHLVKCFNALFTQGSDERYTRDFQLPDENYDGPWVQVADGVYAEVVEFGDL
jgi:hypothetical protein